MNEYQKAAADVLRGKSKGINDWQSYYAAKREYERKTIVLPFNEFEFMRACDAFAKHFTGGGK